MRVFQVAADVAMGLILGMFLFVVVGRTWPSLDRPLVAAAVGAASVLVVLFRSPGGALRGRSAEQPKR